MILKYFKKSSEVKQIEEYSRVTSKPKEMIEEYCRVNKKITK